MSMFILSLFSFNSLPNNKILTQSKLKALADAKINVTQILKFVSGSVENIWLPAFSPFPKMVSKAIFLGVVKVGIGW